MSDRNASPTDTQLLQMALEYMVAREHPFESPLAGYIRTRLAQGKAREPELEALRSALKQANSQAEHFEREWYLRGDELETLRKRVAELERALKTIRDLPIEEQDNMISANMRMTAGCALAPAGIVTADDMQWAAAITKGKS